MKTAADYERYPIRGTYTRRRQLGRVLVDQGISHFLLILFGFGFLLPLIWMISTSLKVPGQIWMIPPKWIPEPFQWSNYARAIAYFPFFRYVRNTLYIAVPSVLGTIFSSAVVAYSFARINWPGRDVLFMIILGTMMLPGWVTIIPMFVLFRTYGWVGTYLPLIVPAFFGNAFFIFLLRQFFLTIPLELSDAARIDGCSEFRIFRSVLLPLSKPALATVTLFQFLGNWNDFFGPLIYLSDERLYTLALGLKAFRGQYTTEWALLMAACTVVTVPIVVLFFFTQRTFIEGIALSGLKQ